MNESLSSSYVSDITTYTIYPTPTPSNGNSISPCSSTTRIRRPTKFPELSPTRIRRPIKFPISSNMDQETTTQRITTKTHHNTRIHTTTSNTTSTAIGTDSLPIHTLPGFAPPPPPLETSTSSPSVTKKPVATTNTAHPISSKQGESTTAKTNLLDAHISSPSADTTQGFSAKSPSPTAHSLISQSTSDKITPSRTSQFISVSPATVTVPTIPTVPIVSSQEAQTTTSSLIAPPYVPSTSSISKESKSPNPSSDHTGIVIGASISASIVLALLISLMICAMRRRRRNNRNHRASTTGRPWTEIQSQQEFRGSQEDDRVFFMESSRQMETEWDSSVHTVDERRESSAWSRRSSTSSHGSINQPAMTIRNSEFYSSMFSHTLSTLPEYAESHRSVLPPGYTESSIYDSCNVTSTRGCGGRKESTEIVAQQHQL